MNKIDNQESLNYESGLASGRLAELHLILPKDVLDRFRQVAKKSKMSPNDLFEEMVETHANGFL